MSVNNVRSEPSCIVCRKARASEYKLWCKKCWEELNIEVHTGRCPLCGAETADGCLCSSCLTFYAPDVWRLPHVEAR